MSLEGCCVGTKEVCVLSESRCTLLHAVLSKPGQFSTLGQVCPLKGKLFVFLKSLLERTAEEREEMWKKASRCSTSEELRPGLFPSVHNRFILRPAKTAVPRVST